MPEAYTTITAHHTTDRVLADAPIWLSIDSNFVRGSVHMSLEDAMILQGRLAEAIQTARKFEDTLARLKVAT